MLKRALFISILVAPLLFTATAGTNETPIGQPVVVDHIIVGAVYLQPVHMAPLVEGMDQPADVHLEADIHADKDNPDGFQPGDWIPYLTVSYEVTKAGTDWRTFGWFMPMTAQDGPHYGANVKLDGPGKYHLSLRILPPSYNGFFRHTDKETGVAPWWPPIEEGWDFPFAGVGKKGGY
jgi:uncharacterized protein involved in high-affinity Fe2+ transport